MSHLIIELSKYILIILFAIYTYQCFAVFRPKMTEKRQQLVFRMQTKFMLLIHLLSFVIIFMMEQQVKYILLYAAQVALFAVILFTYCKVYTKSSRLLVNNMCMLLAIGFVILTRLNFDSALKQFEIAVVAVIITLLIPLIIHKLKVFNKLTWVYAIVGVGALGFVAVAGSVSYGAKLSISLGGISIQPSEFVKIIFVFFVASMLCNVKSFKQVVIATIVAVVHVGILVLSTDLGAALIFFIVYLVMLYVATRQPAYMLAGGGLGVAASLICYRLFSHVRVRVIAWKDPMSVYDTAGYQVAQSLFAIGTGGWFGMGLYQGMPNKIPVVEQDFVFSAISEELGGIFALCIILVCASCFLMFLNISMQIKNQFYKLIALGLGTVYGFQVFLTIGGVIKCIPSTGVTLPLISYGGSSLLSSLIIFAIIQGLYIMRQDEGVSNEKNEQRPRKNKTNKPKQTKQQDDRKPKRKSKSTGFDTQFEDLS